MIIRCSGTSSWTGWELGIRVSSFVASDRYISFQRTLSLPSAIGVYRCTRSTCSTGRICRILPTRHLFKCLLAGTFALMLSMA